MALACAAMPVPAMAEPPAEGGFDLRAVSGKSLPAARQTIRSHALGVNSAPARPEKVKLRLTYQPDEDGPRFEIGTLGSRKGVMKSRLLHIAMDWAF
ncbi:hypothetical protein [Novosphingobium barchaimii]|uniref:hypothetical protein n=1 Tax=Novosphingobium barchaimii TaxID=1420591 RepID=UPI001F3CBBD3|nr:hypothetical protein [Novosphingobium barchaimii]